MTNVVALIHGEEGAYGLSFPDFPGATSSGRTYDEAIARGREGLATHIETLEEEGFEIAVPRTLSELRADLNLKDDFEDAVLLALVPVDLPGRARRFNISMDEALMKRIDESAALRGESRSGFLASAARQRLQSEP